MLEWLGMTSIVLAGGKSTRFGRDKALANLAGQSLIHRVIGRLIPLSDEILVVTAEAKLPFPVAPAKWVTDFYPGKGSLGGIYTGLTMAASFHSLVVACDMPFLNIDLLRYMMSVAEGFDVVMPRIKGKTEALHAVYSKNCLTPIKELLDREELRVVAFLGKVRVRYIKGEEVTNYDPNYLSFFNVNTVADMERAEALVEEQGL
ncbi:MAG: molybdenum cofactor guanylyltransferase [Chloroflexi bacterium]|nr:molybdenum cofactor guanylyltransferase [Chloroflexota bacterium]